MIEKFVVLFCQYVLISTLKYDPGDLKILVTKLEEEREIILDVFSSVIAEKDVEEKLVSFDILLKSLKKPVDEVVVLVVNLRVIMK